MPSVARCSVDICNRAHYGNGLCQAHYDRVRTTGQLRPEVPLRPRPTKDERGDIVARIMSKVVEVGPDGCLEFQGMLSRGGYGSISWNGRAWQTHRAIWTATVGPIPTDDDWTIDHLCRNRACVNVKHMEVVTRGENSRRGGGLLRAQSLNKLRSVDVCKNGHVRTPENTGHTAGYRYCLTCNRAAWAKRADVVSTKRKAQRDARKLESNGD